MIDKFGSEYRLAKMLGCSASTVYRWTYEGKNKGTGGLIPLKWHGKILQTARLEGICLTKEDWAA